MKSWQWIKRQFTLLITKSVTVNQGALSGRFHVASKQDYKVIRGRLSEAELRRSVFDCLRPDDVIYEVGAHVGSWSVFLAQAVPAGHLLAFEPVPWNHDKLSANLAFNELQNAQSFAMALGDKESTASFFVPKTDAPVVGSLIAGITDSDQPIDVQVKTVDAIAEETGHWPTVMKIDCEGAEAMVIEGASKALDRSVRVIFLEVHPVALRESGVNPDDLIASIKSRGFVIEKTWQAGDFDHHLLMVKPEQETKQP